MSHAPLTRTSFVVRLLSAAAADPRIVGVLDYGSTSEGRGDEWSDADLVVFLRDADFAAFEDGWKAWLGQFGRLLLAYTSGLGKPWAVLDATPLPLRTDFNFYPISQVERIHEWPCAPSSVSSMVLYDASGGVISECVAQIIGQPLGPLDTAQAFEQVCGDFWYYALRTWVKLLRGQDVLAYYEYTMIMVANLAGLLRLEAGATARWRNSSAVQGIEAAIGAGRLAEFKVCLARGVSDTERAFAAAAHLAEAVCSAIAEQHGWPWPAGLAAQVVALKPRS